MRRSKHQHHFAAAAEFESEHEWQGADRYIIHAIRTLVQNDTTALQRLIEDMPSADKAEGTPTTSLHALLVTTPIPAFVDGIAAQSRLPAEKLLKPVLRTLRCISAFSTSDNDTLEEGLPAVRHLLRSGRTFLFEYRSGPPGSDWTRPAHGIY